MTRLAGRGESARGHRKQTSCLHITQQLPHEASLEDIMYELFLPQRIDRGLRELAAGRTVSHVEVMRSVAKWLGPLDARRSRISESWIEVYCSVCRHCWSKRCRKDNVRSGIPSSRRRRGPFCERRPHRIRAFGTPSGACGKTRRTTCVDGTQSISESTKRFCI